MVACCGGCLPPPTTHYCTSRRQHYPFSVTSCQAIPFAVAALLDCCLPHGLPACLAACLSLPPATQDAGKMTVSRRGAAISSGIVATLKHNLHCCRNWKVNGNWECKGLSILPPPSSSWSFIYTCHLPVEFLIFSPFVHLFSDWLHHNYPTVLGSLGQGRPKCFLTSSNCCHMHPTPLCCSY